MLISFLAPATTDCILGRFQLYDHAGETLGERIVDIARHSISFFQNGGLPALLGKFIELNCQHRLVRERLSQFDFFRSIRRPVAVTNTDEAFHASANQGRNPQKSSRSASV